MSRKGFQAGLSLVLGLGGADFPPTWVRLTGSSGNRLCSLHQRCSRSFLAAGCASHTASHPVLSWNRFSVIKGRGRKALLMSALLRNSGVSSPPFPKFLLLSLKAFVSRNFLTLGFSHLTQFLGKVPHLVFQRGWHWPLDLFDFKMNRNQQKGEKKNTAYPSDPDILSQPRDYLWLGCLNNLWASDPPPELKFEHQNKYLSCLEQSLRALFSFLLFKAQLYCSAVPLWSWFRDTGLPPRPRAWELGRDTQRDEGARMLFPLLLPFWIERLWNPHQWTFRSKYFQKTPCCRLPVLVW